jgi:putative FmdB family regulatory protein
MSSMPIYEYRCGECGERFEDLLPAGAPAPACPRCGAARAERLFSAQAAPFEIAGTPGSRRKQERENAKLHARAKADFKARRQRTGDARSPGRGR